MYVKSYSRVFGLQLSVYRSCGVSRRFPTRRFFSASIRAAAIKPFLLADIGEGIRECEVIQWFVEPEARVEEWDKLCEVTSDKASVEITCRFAGVIKKLHYEPGEMAKVGKPLVDIDIQGEIKNEDLDALTETRIAMSGKENPTSMDETIALPLQLPPEIARQAEAVKVAKGKHASQATPAVRHLTKELHVKIEDVTGTGRDGRVLKEDVYQFAKQRDMSPSAVPKSAGKTSVPIGEQHGLQQEIVHPLTSSQLMMYKVMTKSLSIPHFLYADEVDFTRLSELRQRLNEGFRKAPPDEVPKLSFLPFIVKAVSMALQSYPNLNARVDLDGSAKPQLILRSQHNIGIAMDTPAGLLVPVIKHVSSLNIFAIALELERLQRLAGLGKLTTHDLSGGSITVSNIGSIGGTYVSPVIVDTEVAILGIGKVRTVPAFSVEGELIQKRVCNFSWSADHRVIDGATMARAAEVVRGFVENPDTMIIHLH